MSRELIRDLILISLSAVIGSLSRYWIMRHCLRLFGSHLPVGTLLINLIGCLLIGFAYGKGAILPPWIGLAVITGFLGSFTTYSSFALDTWKLYLTDHPMQSFLYVLMTLFGGLFAVWLGMSLAKLWR
ncbi:MAG: fluoride efflux transporter CrcB [Candidatus Caenarcaniphilales bacterium]|nr:fluoride efflux transporter CrcB [Candidatus Caenarcaniphilales bacterium]